MTYDAADGYLLLFGGTTGSPALQCLNDTWEFTGLNWVHINTHSAPVGCDIAGSYDPADGYVVLMDSKGTYSLEPWSNATWRYASGEWSLVSVGTGPSPRAWEAVEYDAALRSIVSFGGWYCVSPSGPCTSYNETWTYSKGSWRDLGILGAPGVRNGEVLAYDPSLGASILFGGRLASSSFGDTWQFGKRSWSSVNTSLVSPTARYGASVVYDPTQSTLFLFGGYSSGFYGDTWSFGNVVLRPPVGLAGSPAGQTMFGQPLGLMLGAIAAVSVTVLVVATLARSSNPPTMTGWQASSTASGVKRWSEFRGRSATGGTSNQDPGFSSRRPRPPVLP